MTEPPTPPKSSETPSDKPKADATRAAAPPPVTALPPPPTGPRPTVVPNPGQTKTAEREAVPPMRQSRSRALPVLYFLGFAVLAGAIAWIWQNPPPPTEAPVAALQSRLDAVEARVAQLEARPPQTRPPETRPPETKPAPAFDPAPLLARLAALEARPAAAPVDLAPIETRIAGLEARPVASPADAALKQRVERIGRIQAAAAALEAGRKLGPLPDAPPALQPFADAEPPTEAGLRLAFPAAARAALVASRPIDPQLPWLSRIWGRLQELITIRQGERVLVGDPAAGVIAAARRALDAGDLAGAVAALDRLNPQAAQAIAGWIAQAKALLAARAALAEMAAQG